MGVGTLGYASKYFFSQPARASTGMKDIEIEDPESIGEGEKKEIKIGPGDYDKVLIARY